MKEQEVLQRYYKVSVNIGPFRIYNNSKVYEIHKGKSTIIPGIQYSILTLLVGWWGFGILKPFRGLRNSLEALHINFTGGKDITKLVNENEYDEKTNFIYNNLPPKTKEKLNHEEIEIIIEIQDEYLNSGNDKYLDENMIFIILNLAKLDIHRISRENIRDIFDTVRIHEKCD